MAAHGFEQFNENKLYRLERIYKPILCADRDLLDSLF